MKLHSPIAPADGSSVAIDPTEQGHNDLVGQPHEQVEEGPVAEAEAVAAAISTEEQPMGTPGRRFNRKSPFFLGMTATAGVAVTYGAIQLLALAGNMLILIGLALFLAVGMEPAVSFLAKHRWPRPLGVAAVLLLIVGIIGGFSAAAIPALIAQGQQLIANAPHYLQRAQDHSSFIGKLNDHLHLTQKVQSLISSPGSIDFNGVLSAGAAVFSAITDTLIVLILTAYFLADMPRIRALIYRMVPHTRRPRAYVLGNLLISLIAGGLTFGWLMLFSIPYAALLSIMVALFDLVPVVGSSIAGIIAAAALTISLPLCLSTTAFFIIYRAAEDYFLVPRIIGRAVKVPALVTVVAVLIGGALLGIIGALVAIPAAAAILLITREILIPRLDEA